MSGLVVAVAAAAAVGGALLLKARTGLLERGFIYYPSSTVHSTPADVGLAYEDVSLVASDGVRIEGWFVPGPRPITWLWFPGNAGNIADRVRLIRELHDEVGVSVFIVSYRGYGRSEGRPSEAGLYRDAEAALAHLRSRAEVDADRIVYFGRSASTSPSVTHRTRSCSKRRSSRFPGWRARSSRGYRWDGSYTRATTRWRRRRVSPRRRS